MKQRLLYLFLIANMCSVTAQDVFPDTWKYQGSHATLSSGTIALGAAPYVAPGLNPAGLDVAVIPTATGRLTSPVFVDLDGDNDLDFVSGGQDAAGKLYYFENTGTSTAPNWVQTALPTLDAIAIAPGGTNETKCQFVDIDNDGDMDLFYGSKNDANGFNGNDIHYYENAGTANVPSFVASTIPGILNQNVGNFPSFGFVDLDNDLDYDMVTMSSDSLAYFQNIGTKTTPNFQRKYNMENPWDMDTGTGILDRKWKHGDVLTTIPNFFDIDADGDQDMYFGRDSGVLNWIENIGTASAPDFGTFDFKLFVSELNIDIGAFAVLSFGDVTGDGILDAILGNFNPGYFAWFKGVNSTLGKDEYSLKNTMIYPNPTKDIITINTDVKNVLMYNIIGKKVLESTKKIINVEGLSSGIYFLVITTTTGDKIKKRMIKE